jgi:succinoglycan biosynthesis transport protein ExoP
MPETESSSVDTLQRLSGIVFRGRWWILLTATAISFATVAVLYQIPNRYTSVATLIVVPQQVPARYVTPTTETSIADALPAMTQDVLSRARLLELIDEFGLYAAERKRLTQDEVIEHMRKYIDINPADPTSGHNINSFNISFVAEQAVLAQKVTSKLTSFFIQANLKTREDQAANTANFLKAQLEKAKNKLTAQEGRVRDFKAQYLGELPEQQQGNLAIFNGAQLQLQNLETSLDRAQQQRVYLQSLISGYQRLAARGEPVPGVTATDSSRLQSPLQVAQNDLAKLKVEKTRLLSTYGPAYPDVRAIEREISTQTNLIESLRTTGSVSAGDAHEPDRTLAATVPASVPADDNSITQLKSQLEANRLDIENITKYEAQEKVVISQYQNRLNLTPVREQQLSDILRDYDLSKQDYADLLGKSQQSQLAMSLEKQQGGEQFRLVEPPSLPDRPSSPKRVKLSLMAAGGGLFLGFAVAFFADWVRPTFHTAREISERFGAPLVVDLPVVLLRSERRLRRWKKTLELVGCSVLLLATGVVELYVLRHP